MEEIAETTLSPPEEEKREPDSEEAAEAEPAEEQEQPAEPDAEEQGSGETEEETPAEPEKPGQGADTDSLPDYARALEDRIALLEQRFAEKEQELREMERDSLLRSHYSSLERQAEELRRSLPDFSLKKELEDPEFLRLTSPEVGLSVENAYYALHHGELTEEAEKRGALAVSESISSRAVLPGENGSVRREAVSSQPRLYSRMSPEERLEQKRLILSGMRF